MRESTPHATSKESKVSSKQTLVLMNYVSNITIVMNYVLTNYVLTNYVLKNYVLKNYVMIMILTHPINMTRTDDIFMGKRLTQLDMVDEVLVQAISTLAFE